MRNMEFKTDREKTWLEDSEGRQIALLEHPEIKPGVVCITHTEVDPSYGGRGIASDMTLFVAQKLKREGFKAQLSCSYARKWFSNHPEFSDIVE